MTERAKRIDKVLGAILFAVGDEAVEAMSRFEPFQSPHEGYAVILEEMDELKAHVWMKQTHRDINAMTREAIQVAAMAVRFIHDVCNDIEGRRPKVIGAPKAERTEEDQE